MSPKMLVGRQDCLHKMLALSEAGIGLPTFYVDDPACLQVVNFACLPTFLEALPETGVNDNKIVILSIGSNMYIVYIDPIPEF